MLQRDQHHTAGGGERGQRRLPGGVVEFGAQPAQLAVPRDRPVDVRGALVGVLGDGEAQHRVGGRQADPGPGGRRRDLGGRAVQQRGDQGPSGGPPFVGVAAALRQVSGAGRGGGPAQVVEHQPVEQQQVGGVAVVGVPGDQLPADLHAEVVGEEYGVQRHALLGAPGGGLPDGGELALGGGQSGADGVGEGADPAGGDRDQFAGGEFAGEAAVGRHPVQQCGDQGLGQLRYGAQQTLVGGGAADHRDPPTGCGGG